MNATYPVREGANRFMLWLLAAAVLMAGLFLALRAVDGPVPVRVDHPAVTTAGQAVPQVMPVPEPAKNQPALQSRVSSTPIRPEPVRVIPLLVPQAIPTPPPSQIP